MSASNRSARFNYIFLRCFTFLLIFSFTVSKIIERETWNMQCFLTLITYSTGLVIVFVIVVVRVLFFIIMLCCHCWRICKNLTVWPVQNRLFWALSVICLYEYDESRIDSFEYVTVKIENRINRRKFDSFRRNQVKHSNFISVYSYVLIIAMHKYNNR